MKRLFSLLMIMMILVGAAKASDRKESEMRAIAIQQLYGPMTRNEYGDTKIKLVKKDRYLSVSRHSWNVGFKNRRQQPT